MEHFKQTSKQYFRSLSIINLALTLGQVFFIIITIGLVELGSLDLEMRELVSILALFILFAGGLSVLASYFVFKSKLKKIKQQADLSQKMFDYRAALIMKYALLEGPSFAAIVFCMLTGFYWFLAFSAVIVVVFILIKPSAHKAEIDLELNPNEVQKINDPECVIVNTSDY